MIVRRLRNQALSQVSLAPLAIAILSTIAAAVPAKAAAPGIYSLGGPFNSRSEPNGILTKLSRDGSLAFDGTGRLALSRGLRSGASPSLLAAESREATNFASARGTPKRTEALIGVRRNRARSLETFIRIDPSNRFDRGEHSA